MRRAIVSTFAAALMITALPARAAERDICENRVGQDLVRCIEASARGTAPPPATPSVPVNPAPAASGRGATVPLPVVPEAAPQPRPPPEDCTDRTGTALRQCLAAGGRLRPSAAIVPAKPETSPGQLDRAESCEGLEGEPLRSCVERSARAPNRLDSQRRLICKGYAAADQALCVHRNSAIAECQGNRKRYPDFEVCLRSQMVRAPEPRRAECTKVAPRERGHCEARNRVYERCTSDKIAYFACLERHLGTDAVLRR